MHALRRRLPQLFTTPWFAIQNRGAKVLGTDVRVGTVIERKGRIFQVIKWQHTKQGRGGATIQVELRDVDSGNKVTERFRTDEALEKVFVEGKAFTFLYSEGDTVVIMDPNTFDQLEISKDLFGKTAAYLHEDMKVSVQFYDGKPMSASVPTRVTCTVAEAKSHMKGLTAAPQYKKVLLENGLTVMAPPFIEAGDQIVINTLEDTYMERFPLQMLKLLEVIAFEMRRTIINPIVKYLEQSTEAETVKGKLQAVFLSAEVEAAEESLVAPAQQAAVGDPVPVWRYWMQGLKSDTTLLHVIAASEAGRSRSISIAIAETARLENLMVKESDIRS
ncbi:hypothetical protein IFM89_012307 [Coptis chinensis]|uniref:Elongation factor P n=1 Tax=Coptis chinensis TaxID=261450 RepID=A0A835LR75_9MAGN|nr:hypothetical protein IFM89_012307 [Coptis chinensis]